jgi:hypothetical protein
MARRTGAVDMAAQEGADTWRKTAGATGSDRPRWSAYAAHPARPSRRTDPLLRRTAWPVAVTTGLVGTWVRLQRRPLLQLPVIAATTAAAAAAYARAVPASEQEVTSAINRWVVREPVCLTAGSLTLAAVAATTEVLLAVGRRDLWPRQAAGDRLICGCRAVPSVSQEHHGDSGATDASPELTPPAAPMSRRGCRRFADGRRGSRFTA